MGEAAFENRFQLFIQIDWEEILDECFTEIDCLGDRAGHGA